MAEIQDGTTPTLEVRILRDGVLVQRELVESDSEATAVLDAWSEVEGVEVRVEDLARSAPSHVLDPRPWEVDADDVLYETDDYDDDDER